MTVRGGERYPKWYKDAVIYELHVRAFCDGNADGIGDFPGLISKLDYLHDLNVTALWLLPFYPSPLKDDGYDIADYTDVHPAYGTLRSFKRFLEEANQRGLRVIIELVLNHTSDQHSWFQRARRAPPGSSERDFYVWSDTPERYGDTRVIFRDFEPSNWSWDPVAGAYYWHRFYAHQPDLNYDNPAVRRAVLEVVDFWLGLGVDGLRLDAVPYLYEAEGTSSENLPLTHAFLKELRLHVDARFPDRMLLAEANQWPEDAAAYFGTGDECHMAYHFPMMPRLYLAIRTEDRLPIVDVLAQTPPIPENCQWALFLRNHDELTLEMVSDEERLYLYRAFAQDPEARVNLGIRRRLAPLLGNDRRRIELMNGLLFSLPGTPVLYYGDEIGMGDNIYLGDRNGVRTPMQWSADRNAGFSRANPQRLLLPIIIDPEYNYEAINVETQQKNLSSLLWWTRRVIAMRKNFKAFSRGTLEFLYPENAKVLAFLRQHENETVLVVVNLSRFSQVAELDLSRFAGCALMEVFGQNFFPVIRQAPYVLTLGPHSHFWFVLGPQPEASARPAQREVPTLRIAPDLATLLRGEQRRLIEREVLPDYVRNRRWFASKARSITGMRVAEQIPVANEPDAARIWFVEVTYRDGAAETYTLPVQITRGDAAREVAQSAPHAVIARFAGDEETILQDAVWDTGFRQHLIRAMAAGERFRGEAGEIVGSSGNALGSEVSPASSNVMGVEQSNSSMVFDNKFFLKLYRKLEDGVNPDVEVTRFLSEKTSFAHVPAFAGSIEYRRAKGEPTVIAAM